MVDPIILFPIITWVGLAEFITDDRIVKLVRKEITVTELYVRRYLNPNSNVEVVHSTLIVLTVILSIDYLKEINIFILMVILGYTLFLGDTLLRWLVQDTETKRTNLAKILSLLKNPDPTNRRPDLTLKEKKDLMNNTYSFLIVCVTLIKHLSIMTIIVTLFLNIIERT